MLKNIISTIILLAIVNKGTGQTNQMRNWFIAPNKIEMPFATNPSFSSLPTGAPTCQNLANGMYDNNNNLLFYISDGNVYDYNSTSIGEITPSPQGGEIAIVPFGDNDNNTTQSCKRKYSIFSTGGGLATQSTIALVHTVLDLNSLSLTSIEVDNMPWIQEFGCIAVGKANPIGSRFVYFMGATGSSSNSGRLDMLVLDKFGNVSAPTIILGPTLPSPNSNIPTGYQLFSRELELSPDGKYLAWARFESQAGACCGGDRYNSIEVNPNTGLLVANSFRTFDIMPNVIGNNASGFRGVEFFDLGSGLYRLFLGAGSSGIYYTDFPTNSVFPLVFNSSNTPSYGYSQIEQSFNGKMYVSTSGTGLYNLGAFDPGIASPTIVVTGTPSLTLPLLPNAGWQGNPFYALPDQIDGQDYSLITPNPITPVITANTINFPSNTVSNQTATWTYGTGNNPLSASTEIHIIKELRIRQNSHLVISGMTFKFSENAKVIIEPGSTLTLKDGTIFTSNYMDDPCYNPYTWQGVEVWGGLSNPSQIGSSQSVGKLVMHTATIEYAKCGARAQRYYLNGQNNGRGGIIIANAGAEFINCNIGVQFLPYKNIYNGREFGNRSVFNGAVFRNTDKYPFTSAPIGVSLEGCIGVKFNACIFENINNPALDQLSSKGIKSLNSHFIVANGCSLNNLKFAIDARNTSGTNTFAILNSSFSNNQTGIYAYNINNLTARQNTFSIGNYAQLSATAQLGISTALCSGFSIEENDFELSNPNIGTVKKYGISTNNSGSAPNLIYKNTFSNIHYGNFAMGINRNNATPSTSGLEYICNENSQNTAFDFFVSNKGTTFSTGIRLNQGTLSSSAGNKFSYTGPTGSFTDFNNLSNSILNYYYTLPGIPVYYNGINPTLAANANTCPSNICNPPCDLLLSNQQIQQLHLDYDAAETAYLNLLYSYNQLMDGGNTNALLNQIQTTWSTDAIALRDELFAMSPYVSSDVLREAASRDILPAAMLLMICLANPDATRDEDLLRYLQFEISNHLTQYMIDLIRASWDIETSRTSMENMLAEYNSTLSVVSRKLLTDLYARSSSDIDSLYSNDTTDYLVQIKYWLNRVQTLTSKYDLIEIHLASREFEEAECVLNMIPTDFNLSEDQQMTYDDYVYFYNFRKELMESNQDLSMLNGDQIEALILFTQGELTLAKGLAKNALCFYYDICSDDDYSVDSESGRMIYHGHIQTALNTIEKNKILQVEIEVSPNPAKELATISYKLGKNNRNVSLSICDITGKEIDRFVIENEYGRINWNTNNVNSGLYYYSVNDGNLKIAEGKILVRK